MRIVFSDFSWFTIKLEVNFCVKSGRVYTVWPLHCDLFPYKPMAVVSSRYKEVTTSECCVNSCEDHSLQLEFGCLKTVRDSEAQQFWFVMQRNRLHFPRSGFLTDEIDLWQMNIKQRAVTRDSRFRRGGEKGNLNQPFFPKPQERLNKTLSFES